MAYNQQLSVFSQFSPNTTGTAGQVHVSGGNSSPSYWASAIPVSAYSAQFNGAASYITMPSIAAYSLTADFTIEAWIYCIDAGRTNDANKFGCVISQGISGATTNYWAFYLNIVGGVITNSTIDIGASSPAATISGLSISLNAWHHIAWVRSGSTITLYVDGVSVGTATNATSLTYNSSGFIHVGHSVANYPGAYENWIKGFVSNVRIVKGLAVYTGTFTVPTSPLGTSQSAGTNIAAVTPSQVSLLTCNGPGFTDSSPNAATITGYSTTTSQYAPFSSFSAIARSATQTQTILTSGSGTYYTPSGVAWLRVRMVGGGGGGKGAPNAGGAGSNGSNTTFGSSFLIAGGGLGSSDVGSYNTGTGGTASGGQINLQGAPGGTGSQGGSQQGGPGGSSAFGGAGAGGWNGIAGFAAITNSGSGGGGGGMSLGSGSNSGGGGGSGGYVEAYISSPASSYTYTVGAGGGGGTAGTSGYAGGGGGSGIIIVEENYAVNASGGGGVLQVQSNTLLTTVSTTSTSMTSTGLTVSITPKFSTSKILIIITGVGSASDANANQVQFQIVRNYPSAGTVANGQVAGYNSVAEFAVVEGMRSRWPVNAELMDSPGTTSTITYTLNISVTGATGYLGRWGQDANWNAPTTITLMEIAQ